MKLSSPTTTRPPSVQPSSQPPSDRRGRVTARLTVEVHDRLPRSDAAAWDDLVGRAPLPTPFLRSWWIDALTDSRTRVLLVREGGRLVGGLALELDRAAGIPRWRVLGSGKLCPDHLDLVSRPDRVDDVGDALHAHLTRSWGWFLDLEGVRAKSSIVAASRRAGRRVEERVVERSPYTSLPPTSEEYLASRSKNLRARLRKITRRAERNGLAVRQAAPEETDWVLDRFEELNRARGDRSELLREMPRIRRWVRRGVAAGEVRLIVAELDGRVGVASITLRVAGVTRNYQTVRSLDPAFDDAATLTHLFVVTGAIERGDREFDFLRGAERYKYSFTGDDRPVLLVRSAGGLGVPLWWLLTTATGAAALVRRTRRRVGAGKKSGADGSNPARRRT